MTKTAQHGDQAATDVTGKFWKALLHKTYEIIDKVMKYENCLLSFKRTMTQNMIKYPVLFPQGKSPFTCLGIF